MSKSSKGNGGWLAFTVLLGVVSSVAGLYAFGKDEILSRFMPEFSSARVIDVTEASEQSVVAIVDVIEESSVSKEEIRIIVSEALDEATVSAAKDGRMITGRQSLEFIEAATRVLEQNTQETEKIRLALESSDANGAAEQLVALAKAQTESVDTPENVASETWRNAAALLYPISPEQASKAYRKASELQINDKQLASMAKSIEAELKERASSSAPDAVLQLSGYSGPIKPFDHAIEKGKFIVKPISCEAIEGTIIGCQFELEYTGSEKSVSLSGMRLIDDWSRSFDPSNTNIGERSDNDGSVSSTLAPGKYKISTSFDDVPGGSNYGIQFTLDELSFIWRGVPTEGLSPQLRNEWGGPVGVASFVVLDEILDLEPYALRQTGCERFGRDIRCFGKIAYAGPEKDLSLSELRLLDSMGRIYPAAYSRVGLRSDNDGSVSTRVKTGDYDYSARFRDVPLNLTHTMVGTLNRSTEFQFAPFSFGDQSTDIERMSYLYDFPLRLNVGGDVRFRDFKFYPKGCSREEYSATCDVDFIYVGSLRDISFKNSYLIDDQNNYYPAVYSEILGTRIRDNDGSISGRFSAGKYTLRQKFDSLPPARLFEHKFRFDDAENLFVTNLTLPNDEGRMGLPTDITFTEIAEEIKFDNGYIKTNGCVRRTKGVDCFLEFNYEGPRKQISLDSFVLKSDSAEHVARAVSLGGVSDNDSSVSAYISTGMNSLIVYFGDVDPEGEYSLIMRLNRGTPFAWAKSYSIP